MRLFQAKGRDAEGDVLENLDKYAARAEQHDGAKDGIAVHAQYGLHPAGDHWRH
jgi:hypothetical protein